MDFKIFNRWEIVNIQVQDPGLKNYINLNPVLVPRTGGKYAKTRFWKNKNNIVERLINKVLIPGHKGKKHKTTSGRFAGKAMKASKIVYNAFNIVEEKTKKNPVAVLVKAIENAAPRDEITVIEYGGARYPQAVDVSPLRRVGLALKHIVHGASDKAFGKKKDIAQALAEEIMLAADGNMESFAMKKKNEATSGKK